MRPLTISKETERTPELQEVRSNRYVLCALILIAVLTCMYLDLIKYYQARLLFLIIACINVFFGLSVLIGNKVGRIDKVRKEIYYAHGCWHSFSSSLSIPFSQVSHLWIEYNDDPGYYSVILKLNGRVF